MFLVALGAPTTDPMIKAVGAWLLAESGGHITGNNPWNLHSSGGLPGQTGSRYAGPGDKNVAVFSTLQAGCTASAMNLERLAPSYGYGTVISQARAGNAIGFLDALASSSWSAGHYGGPGANNKLRRIYAGLGGALPPVIPGHEGSPAPASGSAAASPSTGIVLAVMPVATVSAKSCPNGVTVLTPGFSFFPLGRTYPVPLESIGDLGGCTKCADGYVPGIVGGFNAGGIVGPVPFGFVDPASLPSGVPNACVRSDLKAGDAAGAGGAVVDAAAATAAAIASLPVALGNIGAHLVILVVILALIVLGLKAVVDGGSE